uniref:Uncharacterized protein n=1 Tax=Anguilla anguilla TaxID=7936 RepID=A0A0E9RY09_ANGAN
MHLYSRIFTEVIVVIQLMQSSNSVDAPCSKVHQHCLT